MAQSKQNTSVKIGRSSERQSLKSPATMHGGPSPSARELVRAHQQPGLLLALARREAEVQVEHLDLAGVPVVLDGERGVLAAAALARADREVDVALAQDREAAERGVAVARPCAATRCAPNV